jgi:glyoxylase-like metal-dependent hydrolase (beta-lactamase superfamily II)
MIIKQLLLGKDEVFCYILACEKTKEAVIIDACGDEETVMSTVRQLGLQPLYIINTHCHPDHTCGNEIIKQQTGAMIVMHEADVALLLDPKAQQYFSRHGFTPSPPADIFAKDGDIIKFGNHSISIIHTPGHSPGSICLYTNGNLFTGDSLFVGAAGRVDVPGGDFTTLIDSLALKISVLPDETIVWPGHDYGDHKTSTIGKEKLENPYLGGEW